MGLEVRGHIKSLSINMNEHLVSMKDSVKVRLLFVLLGRLFGSKQMRPV